jgi:hypothetical protein
MIVRFYQNRPIKRMRLVPGGILLTFLSPVPGQPGEQRTVSQVDWDRFGEKRILSSCTNRNLRQLAASAS